MASNNNALMLALVAGGGYLAYKSGILKVGGVSNTPPGNASSNSNSAPSAVDSSPAPGRVSTDPRGVRNNNPGNIVYNTSNDWKGQIGSDGTFAKFSDPIYGIRAMMLLLRNYCSNQNLCTIEKIINRWAPAPANNPVQYADTVAQICGVGKSQQLNINDYGTIRAVARAITAVENGTAYLNFYPEDVWSAAWYAMVNP